MEYVFKVEIEKLLIDFKMVCCKKGVARPCARLLFCVGHCVSLGPTKDANVASLVVRTFEIIWAKRNKFNDKMSGKLKLFAWG